MNKEILRQIQDIYESNQEYNRIEEQSKNLSMSKKEFSDKMLQLQKNQGKKHYEGGVL